MSTATAPRIATHHPIFRRHPELDRQGEPFRAWLTQGGPARTYRSKDALNGEGDAPPACFIATGWIGRLAEIDAERRQVIDMLLPGDAIGFEGLATCSRSRLVALTGVQVLLAPRAPLTEAAEDALVSAVAAARGREQQRHISQIVRLGCHTPEERLCSLFLELHERLRTVGLSDSQRLPMPLSQQVLAELIGISAVHVNRTLRTLRTAGLLEIKGGAVSLNVGGIAERFPHVAPALA